MVVVAEEENWEKNRAMEGTGMATTEDYAAAEMMEEEHMLQ